MTSSPKIKLTYFDIEGVAESIRLALILGKVDFEDVRITFPEWPALKNSMPHGTMPVMTIDDGPMRVQSKALLRWVGKKYSTTLYPEETFLDVEEVIGIMEELVSTFSPYWFPNKDAHPDGFFDSLEGKMVLKRMREKYVTETLPKYLTILSDFIIKNDGKWLASKDEPTIADCLAIQVLRNFTRGHIDYIPTTCFESYPMVVNYMKRFYELELVKGRY